MRLDQRNSLARGVKGLAPLVLVFAVFFVDGAWPAPEVNEPYYLCKAANYWNRQWIPNDPFLQSADSHMLFYLAFGWLSQWLDLPVLAWCGRLLTWLLLAWAWCRLCRVLTPQWWAAPLSAALFVCLQERFHMAGEWVVGGVEAKGFAYVLVFLGLESLAAARWAGACLLFGAATAIHVLVGGWSLVALAAVWLLSGRDRPTLRAMVPAIVGAAALSLVGVLPAWRLTAGFDPQVVDQANVIYVFQRLAHHLLVTGMPASFIDRFLLLGLFWALLEYVTPGDCSAKRLRRFVVAALGIAAVGAALCLLQYVDVHLAARLLRFYWFRLADVMLPLGAALAAVRFVSNRLQRRQRGAQWVVAAAVAVALLHTGGYAGARLFPTVPRADAGRVYDFPAWRDVCQWIGQSGQIPPQARFLTPRMAQTFKWYARRSEVATWKDIPQDAPSVVRWWNTLCDIYALNQGDGQISWIGSLARWPTWRLVQLANKYGADYLLAYRWPRHPFPVVYENRTYVVYRIAGWDPAEQARAVDAGFWPSDSVPPAFDQNAAQAPQSAAESSVP